MKTPRIPIAPVPPPVVILPTAVYRYRQLQEALGLPETTLRAEIRAGRLRVAYRCHRYWCLGAWVLEWLESAGTGRQGAVQTAVHPLQEGGDDGTD